MASLAEVPLHVILGAMSISKCLIVVDFRGAPVVPVSPPVENGSVVGNPKLWEFHATHQNLVPLRARVARSSGENYDLHEFADSLCGPN